MIYLAALLGTDRYVLRANHVIAQFTKSFDSLTLTGNKDTHLTVGYWLSRVWGFQQAAVGGRNELARLCPGYLFAALLNIFFKKASRLDFSWAGPLIYEFWHLIVLSARHGLLASGSYSCATRILARALKGR